MYVYPLDVSMVHYYGNEMYVMKKTGNIRKLDYEQTVVMDQIVNQVYQYDRIVNAMGEKIGTDKRQLTLGRTMRVINSISDLVTIGFSSRDPDLFPLISGMAGKYYPLSCVISLTNRCLHYCKHCYMNAQPKGADLDLEHLNNLLEFLSGKTCLVELTGGEPFLYDNFEEILEKYHTDFKFSVITSGFWGKEISETILKRLHMIHLTLYGHTAEEHDAFVGVNGSFDTVTKNIRTIINYGPTFAVQTQARSGDIRKLRKFLDLCVDLGVPNVIIGQIVRIGRAKKMEIPVQYDLVDENLEILKEEYSNAINLIVDSGQGSDPEPNFFNCGAGRIRWHVTENGLITPCDLFDRSIFSMGNISDKNYTRLINSKDVIDDLERYWSDNLANIIEFYSNRGECFEDICHSTMKL